MGVGMLQATEGVYPGGTHTGPIRQQSYANRSRLPCPRKVTEWFFGFEHMKHLLEDHVQSKAARILMLGCGNSTLSADMYRAGYHNITNIDISPTVIEKMLLQHSSMPGSLPPTTEGLGPCVTPHAFH